MYIKFADYKGSLQDGEILLMSRDEFISGGKEITYVPVCVTPDGEPPKEDEYELPEQEI